MAGHSHAANIKHKKGAADAKRGSIFTKLIKTICTLAKSDPDPNSNPTLRTAIQKAISASVPKDKIENAIKRASGQIDGQRAGEIRYNATVGPVAFIIEVLTSNKNRAAAEVRAIFAKHGGNLVETGSIEFMFENCGIISYPKNIAEDAAIEAAIATGCKDFYSTEANYQIITQKNQLHEVLKRTVQKFGDPIELGVVWMPRSMIDLTNEEEIERVATIINALEDCQDVENVFCNTPQDH